MQVTHENAEQVQLEGELWQAPSPEETAKKLVINSESNETERPFKPNRESEQTISTGSFSPEGTIEPGTFNFAEKNGVLKVFYVEQDAPDEQNRASIQDGPGGRDGSGGDTDAWRHHLESQGLTER